MNRRIADPLKVLSGDTCFRAFRFHSAYDSITWKGQSVSLGVFSGMVADNGKDHEAHLTIIVKIIILSQATVILSLTVGMYQEYANNLYLQQYVISLFKSNIVADAILSMVTVSVFAIGTLTLLGSMSSTKKLNQWNSPSEDTEEEMGLPVMPVLETAEPRPRPLQTRRSSHRRKRKVNDDLFLSMTRYAEKSRKQ